MWAAQQAALADEFRTIAMDLPAHGSRAAEPFTLDAAAAARRDASATEAGGRAVVVGLSLGGYVAMALAAREPELVRGLVLSGATAEPVGIRMLPYPGLAAAHGPASTRSVLDAVNARFFRRATRRPSPSRSSPAGSGRRAAREALRAIVGERFLPRLAAYPGPTLILNGSRDLPFRVFAPTFAAAARDARRVRLAGAHPQSPTSIGRRRSAQRSAGSRGRSTAT